MLGFFALVSCILIKAGKSLVSAIGLYSSNEHSSVICECLDECELRYLRCLSLSVAVMMLAIRRGVRRDSPCGNESRKNGDM